MARTISSRTIVGGTAATAMSALALSLALPGLKEDEGKSNAAYLDIVKVPTICYGHTGKDVRLGNWLSDPECEALLAKDAQVALWGTAKCAPGLMERPYQWAASVRFAVNLGVPTFCKSTAARRFNGGDWKGGCNAFAPYNRVTYPKPRPRRDCIQRKDGRWACVVEGLTARRGREMALCSTGLLV